MLKSKTVASFFVFALTLGGSAFAAENPAAAVATGDLARRLYVPESKIAVVSSENGTGGVAVVSLQVTEGKAAKPTHRYTLRPDAGGFQVLRVDYANGAHDEYEYAQGKTLTTVKQFGRQTTLLHTVHYERDPQSGLDRVAKVVHHDWTRPLRDNTASVDLYRYGVSGALEKVEQFPDETHTAPENLIVARFYEGKPGLEKAVKSVDSRGMETSYEYRADGTLAKTVAKNGVVTDYGRNELGQDVVAKTTDFRGMETVFSYDSLGGLVKTSSQDGTSVEFTTIADRTLPVKVVDIRSVVENQYDATGALVKSTVLTPTGEKVKEIEHKREGASGKGFLQNSTTSNGFKYTYRIIRFQDTIETATDPKGRKQSYTYDDLVRPVRVVHGGSGTPYVDEYEYSPGKGAEVSAIIRRFRSDASGGRGDYVGAFQTGTHDRPIENFQFETGEVLAYEKGLASELKGRDGSTLLTFKNETRGAGQLVRYDVVDASGQTIGSYEYFDDPADVAATYLQGKNG